MGPILPIMLFVMYVKSSGRRETTSFITSAAFSLTMRVSRLQPPTFAHLLLRYLQALFVEREAKADVLHSSLEMSLSTHLPPSFSRRRTSWTTFGLKWRSEFECECFEFESFECVCDSSKCVCDSSKRIRDRDSITFHTCTTRRGVKLKRLLLREESVVLEKRVALLAHERSLGVDEAAPWTLQRNHLLVEDVRLARSARDEVRVRDRLEERHLLHAVRVESRGEGWRGEAHRRFWIEHPSREMNE